MLRSPRLVPITTTKKDPLPGKLSETRPGDLVQFGGLVVLDLRTFLAVMVYDDQGASSAGTDLVYSR